MSVFGVIASGRLPQTDCVEISPGKYLMTIQDADAINHLVVFLTGITALPVDMGGSVYFSWPDPNAPQTWQYLGFVSNDKPSTVFRLTKLREGINEASGNLQNNDIMQNNFAFNQTHVSHVAQIGISIEPLTQINQQTPSSNQMVENFTTFTMKTAENLFNYVSSFAKIIPGTNEQVVPLRAIQSWYANYSRKLEINPNFWRS